MKETTNRNMIDIIQRTLDYFDTRLVRHGKRVAGMVCRMLNTQGTCDETTMRDLCFLALIHDIGAYKTEEIDQLMRFEQDNVQNHSVYGSLFIRYLTPLGSLAPVVAHHHSSLETLCALEEPLSLWAQIFHLADRVDIYLQLSDNNFEQLYAHLEASRGIRFSDQVLDLFYKTNEEMGILAQDESDPLLMEMLERVPYTWEEINDYFLTIIFAIDFRSHHTVTHTVSTIIISYTLAQMMGIEGEELEDIRFGALLHDLGKIGIPVEILEFPGKLSPQAMRVMRTHVELSDGILRGSLREDVLEIALRHHEKLDGSGYPLGLCAEQLTLGQRIVAVADIMSALCGTRSYKEEFPKEKTIKILSDQAKSGEIDPEVTALLIEHYDEVHAAMEATAQPVRGIYETINERYRQILRIE